MLDAISKQVVQLLQHVGEVRQSTRRLEEQYDGLQSDMTSMRGEMKSMRDDIRALDHKIDKRTEFLVGKIEHHVGALRVDMLRDRTRFDEERYIRRFRQREIEERLDDVEARVARLEAQSSSPSSRSASRRDSSHIVSLANSSKQRFSARRHRPGPLRARVNCKSCSVKTSG